MKRKNPFLGIDILSVDQFTKQDLLFVFKVANQMKKLTKERGGSKILAGNIMTALFYEPSSRTIGSFSAAMQRLGGGVIPLQGMTHSSVAKGERFNDTIRTFACYSDVIVIRHPEVGSAKKAAEVASIPIINGGDGIGEHPTQALLDLFTMVNRFKKIDGLKVALVGDLLNGRTVHSLAKLLVKMGSIELFFVSPKILRMPKEVKGKLGSKIHLVELERLENVIDKIDIIYMTRVQKERFKDLKSYERLKDYYILTKKLLEKAKKSAIIMHPLPRIGEISEEVDSDPRALYLTEQMQNGLYVRMALLAAVLGKI